MVVCTSIYLIHGESRNISLLILEKIKEVFLVELALEVALSYGVGSRTLNV